MFNVQLRPSVKPSMWRKMAVAAWRNPVDPQIYARLEVDMAKALEYAERLHVASGVQVSPTHLVAKAVAVALREYPDANAMIRWNRVRLRRQVNLFFQVAVPGKKLDLTGAVIRDADTKPVADIAEELKLKAAAARRGLDEDFSTARRRLDRTPSWLYRTLLRGMDSLQHTLNLDLHILGLPRDALGGAMITSVGSMGIPEAFAPLVPFTRTPLVVSVGKVEEKPVVRHGAVVIRPMCIICATLDHRVFDGLLAAHVAKSVLRYLADRERRETTAPRGSQRGSE